MSQISSGRERVNKSDRPIIRRRSARSEVEGVGVLKAVVSGLKAAVSIYDTSWIHR